MTASGLSRLLLILLPLIGSFDANAEEQSLYARLGGEPVVSRVVEQTVSRIANDPRHNHSLAKVNLNKLYKKLTVHLCAITGGGCEYTGDDMKTVHAGLDITQGDNYAMIESLRQALDENGIGEREKNELLKILAPFEREVVSK